MATAKEILTKLGMAIYLHRAFIKQAEKGKAAVDYLARHGVFRSGQKA
jgi:hypothetical protein